MIELKPFNDNEIAVDTVKAWLAETGSQMKVVFNVYKDLDLKIYSELLQ
jgi:O-acetyl-ADP-ribose deacetylase (regulator of RNase III)